VRFLYRPTNDPIHPGWSNAPGSAGQIEDAWTAAHAAAEAFRAYIAAAAYPAGVLPFIVVEIDINPGNVTRQEFYKFRVVTR